MLLSKLSSRGHLFNIKIVQNALAARSYKTEVPVGTVTTRGETIVDWQTFKMPNAPYDGMGPVPPVPEWDPKSVRHHIFPEYWFQFLKPRLGLSGPYTLGIGLATFFLSKEWYVTAPEAVYLPMNMFLIYAFVISKFHSKATSYLDNEMYEKQYNEKFELKVKELEKFNSLIDEIKTEQWRAELQDLYNEARSANLSLMLETEFKNRQLMVANAVKSKMEYQVAVEKVDKELAQDHMVQWIEDKVRAGITPASQKVALDACIKQLNTIPV